MKRYLTIFSLVVTMFSINFDSKAAVITAVGSGNWDSPFTWSPSIPECGDTVIIPPGITVTVTVNVNLDTGDPLCPLFRMTVLGNLRFAAGKKLNLAAGSCVSVEATGSVAASAKGGGASESIYIGPDRVWQASGGILNGIASLGCSILLPVNIIEFEAIEKGDNVVLKWEVNSEQNVNFYEIEYSETGLNWDKFAQVMTDDDASIRKTYTYESKSLNKGVYFRLSNIDHNGVKTYLSTIRFDVSELFTDQEIAIIPNPVQANQLLTINYETQNEMVTSLNIVDQRGVIIYSITKTENSDKGELIFDTSILKSGTYFVNLDNKNQSLKSKLAVL